MIERTKRILLLSLAGMLSLCIVIFIWIFSIMSKKSEESISEIGMIYMSEMSKQMQQKFDGIITVRLSQVEGIVKRTPPESSRYSQELLDELVLSANVRNLSYLGFYTQKGEHEDIFGGPLDIIDENEFLETLKNEEKKVTSAFNESGEKLLVLVVDAEYEMKGGEKSSVLVAGIPMGDLQDAMVLESDDSLVYSNIIRRDGSYVIRSSESYFSHIAEAFTEINGKKPEQYVEELEAAMREERVYSALIAIDGTYRHLYCSKLPKTDWYLVSVMPNGALDAAVNHLGSQRAYTMMGACSIVLLGILVIFALYYHISQQQIRALNEARQEAIRANKAKSEFLSNMSHDIRTPMNGIVGMTAIAMTNINDNARVQECLKKITLSSKHLLGLINDILDMSKIENGKLTLNMYLLSLRDTMESIVNIVQPQIRSREHHFDIFIQRIESEEVYCDSVRLNQVLINLLSNAIKFTPEKGRINVYLDQESSPLGERYVRCHFRVKDTGIGMTKEFQEKIFETFSRADNSRVQKTEGAGLGMAITKHIVEAMGGTIEVESEPGKGSEFHVILDLERASVKEEDMVLPPWNMLVVDNNYELCESAVSVLKEIGIHAEWALDGMTAVQMVEKHHEENNDYEIVLLDWKMPVMDGLETTREIRRRVGDAVPILIISAYDWSDIEEEAREAGAMGFISKPLFKSNLYLGLSRYMEGMPEIVEEEEVKIEKFVGKRILLAEDNDLNWEIANEILTEAGFEVEWAENGKLCVEKFQAATAGHYDLILMDIRMPVMNGYEAAKAIRGLDRPDADIPIIAMTADAFSEDIQRCLECGMNAHVAKPIDIEKLMFWLQKYLRTESKVQED
ncbi:response regulator [Lachnospiraceae bacterium 62-35]